MFALSSLYAPFSRCDGLARTTQTRASQWSPSAAASKVRWLGGVATAMMYGRWWCPLTWSLVAGREVLYYHCSFLSPLPSFCLPLCCPTADACPCFSPTRFWRVSSSGKEVDFWTLFLYPVNAWFDNGCVSKLQSGALCARCGAHCLSQEHTQILEDSRLRGPPRGDTTSIQLQSSARSSLAQRR